MNTKEEILELFGEQDRYLIDLERKFGVKIYCQQNENHGFVVEVVGRKDSVVRFHTYILRLKNNNYQFSSLSESGEKVRKVKDSDTIYITHTGRHLKAMSSNQKNYVDAIDKYDIVIGVGPAGTGKTFLAVAKALSKLEEGRVNKIVLTRPVVESGEKLGFLPGDLYEKINPYLRPLYDAFISMLGFEKFQRYREIELIEIIPLAYMRGRTLEDAFIILDEAQNTVPEQIKMFLTRLGVNSKLAITGDVTQIDLEKKSESGLLLIMKILKGIEGIKFVFFQDSDIVRHKLVKEIVKAYERWERNNLNKR